MPEKSCSCSDKGSENNIPSHAPHILFWHFIAGVVFWGSYALWGMNPWIFSLVMNGVSGLATAVVTAIVAVVINDFVFELNGGPSANTIAVPFLRPQLRQ
jgi:type IV secretory pathway VirB6-like protein